MHAHKFAGGCGVRIAQSDLIEPSEAAKDANVERVLPAEVFRHS